MGFWEPPFIHTEESAPFNAKRPKDRDPIHTARVNLLSEFRGVVCGVSREVLLRWLVGESHR